MLTSAQRDAVAETLARQPMSLAVTLRYNDWPISLDKIRRDIRTLHAHLDRRLYGRRFHLSRERSFGWWVIEKIDFSPHLHGAIDLTTAQQAIFVDMLDHKCGWERIAGLKAEHDVRHYCDTWAKYATKSLTDMAYVIMSADFLPSSQ